MSDQNGGKPSHEDLLTLGLTLTRDAVDNYPDLTPVQRRAVLIAFAGFIADLRAAGAVR